jgi:chemotaxis protein histidine kinase CheA
LLLSPLQVAFCSLRKTFGCKGSTHTMTSAISSFYDVEAEKKRLKLAFMSIEDAAVLFVSGTVRSCGDEGVCPRLLEKYNVREVHLLSTASSWPLSPLHTKVMQVNLTPHLLKIRTHVSRGTCVFMGSHPAEILYSIFDGANNVPVLSDPDLWKQDQRLPQAFDLLRNVIPGFVNEEIFAKMLTGIHSTSSLQLILKQRELLQTEKALLARMLVTEQAELLMSAEQAAVKKTTTQMAGMTEQTAKLEEAFIPELTELLVSAEQTATLEKKTTTLMADMAEQTTKLEEALIPERTELLISAEQTATLEEKTQMAGMTEQTAKLEEAPERTELSISAEPTAALEKKTTTLMTEMVSITTKEAALLIPSQTAALLVADKQEADVQEQIGLLAAKPDEEEPAGDTKMADFDMEALTIAITNGTDSSVLSHSLCISEKSFCGKLKKSDPELFAKIVGRGKDRIDRSDKVDLVFLEKCKALGFGPVDLAILNRTPVSYADVGHALGIKNSAHVYNSGKASNIKQKDLWFTTADLRFLLQSVPINRLAAVLRPARLGGTQSEWQVFLSAVKEGTAEAAQNPFATKHLTSTSSASLPSTASSAKKRSSPVYPVSKKAAKKSR